LAVASETDCSICWTSRWSCFTTSSLCRTT